MTQYILHGGMVSIDRPSNNEFFKLMADCVPENDKWLACNFARAEEDIPEVFERDSNLMQKALAGKNITLQLATRENFLQELSEADVLYIVGGEMGRLMSFLNDFSNIKEKLSEKKVIAGSSAGMCVLSRDYPDSDGTIKQGLGLIPFGAVVHHRSLDKQFNYCNSTEGRKPPFLKVHESQFCVIEI